MGEKMVSVPHTVMTSFPEVLCFLIAVEVTKHRNTGFNQIIESIDAEGGANYAFSDTFLLISGLLFIAFLLVLL